MASTIRKCSYRKCVSGISAKYYCKRCRLSWYCTSDCLRKGWGGHKRKCITVGPAIDEEEPLSDAEVKAKSELEKETKNEMGNIFAGVFSSMMQKEGDTLDDQIRRQEKLKETIIIASADNAKKLSTPELKAKMDDIFGVDRPQLELKEDGKIHSGVVDPLKTLVCNTPGCFCTMNPKEREEAASKLVTTLISTTSVNSILSGAKKANTEYIFDLLRRKHGQILSDYEKKSKNRGRGFLEVTPFSGILSDMMVNVMGSINKATPIKGDNTIGIVSSIDTGNLLCNFETIGHNADLRRVTRLNRSSKKLPSTPSLEEYKWLVDETKETDIVLLISSSMVDSAFVKITGGTCLFDRHKYDSEAVILEEIINNFVLCPIVRSKTTIQ